jgi:hypothetical protein
MGKNKDKKGKKKGRKKDASESEAAAPKLPEGLVRAGRAAMKLAEQPVVSEAVAAALLAAAAALRDGPAVKKDAAAGEAAQGAGTEPPQQTSALGDTLKSIALDVAKRTMEAWEESGKRARKRPEG